LETVRGSKVGGRILVFELGEKVREWGSLARLLNYMVPTLNNMN